MGPGLPVENAQTPDEARAGPGRRRAKASTEHAVVLANIARRLWRSTHESCRSTHGGLAKLTGETSTDRGHAEEATELARETTAGGGEWTRW